MNFKKLSLVIALITFNGLCFADNNFPLANNGNQSQNNNVGSQPVFPQPVSNSNNQVSQQQAVPQIGNSQNNDPVNSGNIVVNNNSQGGSKLLSSNDNSQDDLNAVKKRIEAQKQMNSGKSSNMMTPTITSPTAAVIPEKPVSATMIGYLILDGGQKLATIQYADNSTLEVQLGSLVAGYKVTKITTDTITLNKYDKTVSGKNLIYVRKSNPILSGAAANPSVIYSNSQQLDMDKVSKNGN